VRLRRTLLLLAAAPAVLSSSLSAQAKGALPVELFAYDRAAPLELRDSVLGTEDGVAIHAVSYASPKGGRVTGRLFVPTGRGPFAGVVLAHGMPGNAEAFTGRAVYIARHGAVVIAIDAPFNRRPGPPLAFTPADSVEQVQLIVDLQRAVDVLAARPDVDASRLAYVGRSYGGATGALFAGIERRLRTYVLAVADGGFVAHSTGPGGGDDEHPPFPEIPVDAWKRWLAAMRPVEPILFVARAAPASIFFQSATRDQFVARDDAEALQAAATGPREVKWYDTPHALDAQAHVDQLAWLAKTVGTTPPGSADQAGPRIPPPPTRPAP
jgi:dienelactone hydrolase